MALVATKRDDVFALQGAIDEYADFSPVKAEGGRLALDLAGIEAINSRGVATFQAFIDTWGGAKVEYRACSIVVLDSLIMLPLLLGPEENTARIVSFQCLYICERCRSDHSRLVQATELAWQGDHIAFPPHPCNICHQPAKPSDIAEDMVSLWEVGALAVGGRIPQP